VEVDLDAKGELSAQGMHSKAGWTPYEGRPVRGAVRRVVLRGETVFTNGKVIAPRGFGKNLRANNR
jgi:carbamoyl-phosphate synthase/aspartate carbamoyltransferase/dihydroorotase